MDAPATFDVIYTDTLVPLNQAIELSYENTDIRGMYGWKVRVYYGNSVTESPLSILYTATWN